MLVQVVGGGHRNGFIEFFPPAFVKSQTAQVNRPKILERMVSSWANGLQLSEWSPVERMVSSWANGLQLSEWSPVERMVSSWANGLQLSEWSPVERMVSSWANGLQLSEWSPVERMVSSWANGLQLKWSLVQVRSAPKSLLLPLFSFSNWGLRKFLVFLVWNNEEKTAYYFRKKLNIMNRPLLTTCGMYVVKWKSERYWPADLG